MYIVQIGVNGRLPSLWSVWGSLRSALAANIQIARKHGAQRARDEEQ
jgi:hypothetical protein